MARGRHQKWICKDCKAEFQVQLAAMFKAVMPENDPNTADTANP